MTTIHEVFPYLCVRDASAAVAFYRDVFGVSEKFRLVEPSGRVGHVELAFGSTIIMLSEEYPECGVTAPGVGHASHTIHLHVDNCDAVIERMVAAGGELVR